MWSLAVYVLTLIIKIIISIFLLIFCFFLGLRLWYEPIKGVCKAKTKLHGKVALITGGNSGIGLETAKDLAKRGARVIIASRNDEKSAQAVEEIKQISGNNNVEYRHLNLGTMENVREFAKKFNKDFHHLDILVNNAGSGAVKYTTTAENIDLLMAINYVGPFLLTYLLLDKLIASKPSRIVIVSSFVHFFAKFTLDELTKCSLSTQWIRYGNTKLCDILWTKELSRRLPQGVTVNVVHPGLGRTGVLIACYLVYSLRIRANDAIRLVRKKRPKSVQMSGQILCVQQFEHYLLPQTIVFSSKEPIQLTKDRKTSEFTLRQYLYRQRATLHGVEERAFRELPKIVYCLCERLLKLCGCTQNSGVDLRVRNRPFYKTFLVYKLKQGRQPNLHTPDEVEITQVTSLPMVEWRDPIEEDVERNLESVSRLTGATNGGIIPAVLVHEAFIVNHESLPDDKQKYLKKLRTDINQRRDDIAKIEEEEDPVMLTGLLFEWLEGLKQPVLNREDLSTIVAHCNRVESCIQALQMEDVMLLEYLLRFVIRLRPLAANKKIDIIKRLVASLTHQTISINGKSLPIKDLPKLREGTSNQIINFMLRLLMEIQKDIVKPGRDDMEVIIPQRRLRIKAWK